MGRDEWEGEPGGGTRRERHEREACLRVDREFADISPPAGGVTLVEKHTTLGRFRLGAKPDPSRGKLHVLCVCADATENLAMTIRAALDTSTLLAEKIDAEH